jgi:hypothetical protein
MNGTATKSVLSPHPGVLWILLLTILVFFLFALAAAWIGKTEADDSRSDDGDLRGRTRIQEQQQ